MSTDPNIERQRIDRWLWCTRFFKTRSQASAAVNGGKVRVNGDRVKPAYKLKCGDQLRLDLQGASADLDVVGFPLRRGPAAEAQKHYTETPASSARRLHLREQLRLADLSRPRPDTRPNKRDRRRLIRLQHGQ